MDPLEEPWTPQQVELMRRLRASVVAFTQLDHRMAAWLQLPTSDAHALGQITFAAQQDEPLSPVLLAHRIGMTTGAVSILLDRLESAGLIVRSRESSDRRRVTLRPSELARARVRQFLIEAGTETAAALRSTPVSELEAAITVLTRFTDAAEQATRRLLSPR